MKAAFRGFAPLSKKHVIALLIACMPGAGMLWAQLQYVPTNERLASGMGVDRVAMYFTQAYQSAPANTDDALRWVQVDLEGRKKIQGIKLLPRVVVPGSFIHSDGFPLRFKIEISDDPSFATAVIYEDRTRTDYRDPYDEVCVFNGKEVYGRYVRLTAIHLRQQHLALTKMVVLSEGNDIAQGCTVVDSAPGGTGLKLLTRVQRPQGEGVVTDHPDNVIPFESWKPVAYKAAAPKTGVNLGDGLFKKTMENNIEYLLNSFTLDQLVRNFRLKAGLPVAPLEDRLNNFWMVDIPGSEAGRFLMGAGNTLRWMKNAQLRERMNQIVDVIDQCKEADGYLMAYPKNKIFDGEYGAYTRSWVTQGLIEAGYAGSSKAFSLLRGFYNWFDSSCYLPELLRRGGQGTQGLIPNTRMYFTPVGKAADIQVVQRYFQENYWLNELAQRDPEAIWRYPYDRPHCYLITGIEPYLDMYRATGAQKYLDAALGGWELYHNDWEHIGGTIAICEGYDPYPPKSYYLHKGTGELCGSVFWSFLNQRFHLLHPEQEKYVTEIEKSIYNVLIANQVGSKGIRYTASLVDHKGRGDISMSTCCEGQGTRMMGALPEFIYSVAHDGMYVNLFSASNIRFPLQKDSFALKMETAFPYDPKVRLITEVDRPTACNIRVRIPSWASHNMDIMVNGKKVANGHPGTYVTLNRTWQHGDVISFTLPMGWKVTRYNGAERDSLHERYALEYGPLLMALVQNDAGKESLKLPVAATRLARSLKPVAGMPLHFTVEGDQRYQYRPYFEVQDEPFTCFAEASK